jgi:hypothetical protein
VKDHIHLKIKGDHRPKQKEFLREVFDEVILATQTNNCPKILADFTELDMEMTILDKYTHIVAIADKLMRPRIKVAVLLDNKQTNNFGHTVAKNRGIHSEIFTNKIDALEWLLK